VTAIFIATEMYGSEICWSRFLDAGKFHGAEVLIREGDTTGKAARSVFQQVGKTSASLYSNRCLIQLKGWNSGSGAFIKYPIQRIQEVSS
jgi:hypothetical protein